MPKLADSRRAGLPKRRETNIANDATGEKITEVSKPDEPVSLPPQENPDESEAIAELAQAKAHQVELESAHALLVEEEKATAGERFARMTRDRFVADRAAWLADPALNLPIFGSTFEGANYLASLWADFAAALAPEAPGPTFEQARLAAAALGSRWQVAQVRGEAVWLMARYVRSTSDPESMITRWIKESGTPDDTRERADWHLRHTPEGLDARTELTRSAAAERQRWSAEAARLQARAERSRSVAIETSVGTGSADPALEKRFRLLNRLLTQARGRTDKLQRRLDTLKKRRPTKEMRNMTESRDRTEVTTTQRHLASKSPDSHENGQMQSEIQSTITQEFPDNRPCVPDSNAIAAELSQSEFVVKGSTGTEMRTDITDDKRNRLIKGLSRFRRIDWGDPHAIAPEDVEVITNLRNLPVSLQRDTIVRLTFGSEINLGKAWRQYSRWRDAFEPMGVAPASFEE